MYSSTTVFYVILPWICQYGAAQMDVTLPIIMPDISTLKDSVLRKAIPEINQKIVRPLRYQKINLRVEPIQIATGYKFGEDEYAPEPILQMFNNSIMKNEINTAIVIQTQKSKVISTEYIMAMLDQLDLPVLSFDPFYPGILEKIHDKKVLQFAPTVYHEAKAMIQLLEMYNWTHFTPISTTKDNYFDFIGSVNQLVKERNDKRKSPLVPEMKILAEVVCEITAEDYVLQGKEFEACLTQKVPSENRVFLLHTESAKTLLEAAKNVQLTTKEFMWLLTSSSIGLIGFAVSPSIPTGVIGVTYQADKTLESEVISNAVIGAAKVWFQMMVILNRKGTVNLFPEYNTSTKWNGAQAIYSQMLGSRVTDPMIEFTENGMNKYATVQFINCCSEKSITSRRSIRTWQQVGDWVPRREGFQVETKIEMSGIVWPGGEPFPPLGKPARRFFKIATLEEAPYVMYRDRDAATGLCNYPAMYCRVTYNATVHGNDSTLQNGTVQNCCTGLSIDLLRHLSDQMKFDFDMFEVPDKAFGIQDRVTGEWSGLIKLLEENKADMVMTSLQITPSRSKAIKFSMPYLETGTTIVVSLTKGAISATAVLEPYDYPAWCLILVFSVHSIGASIFIFEWLSPAGLNQGTTPMREHKFSLFRSFWLIWAMLFGAAVSTDNPRGVSSRFLGNVWALFALVFLASYTANLAAFMITKETYYDLSGIQDWRLTSPLLHKPRPFKFATVPNGSTEENLRETRPSMYKYMQQFNKKSVKEAIAALKSQEINAFIYDATPLYYQVGIDPECNLRTVGQAYAMTGYGVGFPQDVDKDLVKEIDNIILNLQEDGELDRLRKFWLAGACHSKNSQKRSSDELGILNFTSAFILLAAGIVLGGLLLILEHMYFRFGRKCLREYDKCGCCALVSLSMGKSLTFEQTIMEAIDLHKKHKCKDPLCETQLWKSKHELDLALLKIQKLTRELGAVKQAPAIKGRAEIMSDSNDSKFTDEQSSPKADASNGEMRQRRHDSSLRRSPSYTSAIGDGHDLNNDHKTNSTKMDNNEQVKFDDGEV